MYEDSSEARAPGKQPGGREFESLSSYKKRRRWQLIWGERLGNPECPFMVRWALLTPWCSLRLHHWLASDDERGFHDHPWDFWTLILKGSYLDMTPGVSEVLRVGDLRFRKAGHKHTVKLHTKDCWSFVFTKQVVRFWGFWHGDKFIKSNKYFLTYGHHPCKDPEKGAP